MDGQIVMRVGKFWRLMSWCTIPIFGLLLFLGVVEALESESQSAIYQWGSVGIMLFVIFFIPYFTNKQKIVITDKEVIVTLIYEGTPVSVDSIEEVRFIGVWGIPKPKKNVLNIGPGFENKKAALDFFEGKAKIMGAKRVK